VLLLWLCVVALPAHSDEASVLRLLRAGDAARAVEQARADVLARPRDAATRFTLSVALSEARLDDEAIRVLEQVIEDYPELTEPYNNLAVLHARRGAMDQARAALETAVQRNPMHAIAFENLGDVYAALAARSWARSAEIDPGRTGALTKLGLVRELRARGASN
jgi:tetratricopeptide (TPR) repeat protein